MHPPRSPNFIRWIPGRGTHAVAALTLAFALVAGLACDENAPTETRIPAGAPQGDLSDDPGAVPFDGGTLSAIGLPVNQSVATTAPAPAFRINQTGSGPNGIFQISNTSNTQPAIQGLTNGRGRAGFFRLTNAANTQAALLAQTNGSGPAVSGLATGFGFAGSFSASGHGIAGSFTNTNTDNANPVLRVQTNGVGAAGVFRVNSPNGTGFEPALTVETNAPVEAVRVVMTGENSNAGRFESSNGANGSAAVSGRHSGSGAGGEFEVSGSNGSPALVALGNPSVANNAAVFFGNVSVQGTLTKTAGSFKIDHPLDPEHKYLSHSFVESPDMKNVYDGTVTLDVSGRATVELPEYFEALNKDFRYQLTAIGAPGPNLYVAEGVKQNRFKIAGGRPYASVSWMVTGVRQDTYANEHRIKVEEEKPKAKGELVARR